MSKTPTVTNGEADKEALALLRESATPELYHRNGFRVLELHVDATSKDINRRKQIMEMAAANGVSMPAGPGRCFPVEPAPDEFTVREAVQRLGDPERRLVDEFFWFWPHEQGQGKSDQSLQHLVQGNHERASELWSQQEANQSVSHVSTHNLAVFHHLLALQWENHVRANEVSGDEKKNIEQLWSRAFRRWQKLLDEEGFWSRLTARVREFEDPRLTAGTIRRMRSALPAALLSINAQLALQAVEEDKKDSAARLVEVIQKSGFPDAAIKDGLRQAVEPVRARIKALCKAAEHSAENDPAHANKACRQLLADATPLLGGLDNLLPVGDPTRDVAHDDVAEQMLRCQIAFTKKTDNWQEALNILDLAVAVASSNSVSKKLKENLETVRDNAKETNWWCAPGYWDCEVHVISDLERARQMVESMQEDAAIEIICGFIRQCLSGKLDERHKPVLERCLASALNRKAVRTDKEAWAEYNEDPPAMRRVREKLRGMSNYDISRSVPELDTGSRYGVSTLRCVKCGDSIYSTYYQRKFGEVNLAFCTSCNSELRSAFEDQERVRNRALADLLELVMLALELNPQSTQLRTNCDGFREQARKHSLTIPSNTLALRRQFAIVSFNDLLRELPRSSESEQRSLWSSMERTNSDRARGLQQRLLEAARQLLEAAEAGDSNRQRASWTILNEAGSVLIQEAVVEAAKPLLARLKALAADANRQMEADFLKGCEIVQTFIAKAQPLLTAFEQALNKGHRTLEEAGDTVVQAALPIVREFCAKTDQWRNAAQVLERLASLPCYSATANWVKEELAKAKANAEETNWWCGDNYFAMPTALFNQLEAARSKARDEKWSDAIQSLVGLLLGKAGIVLADGQRPVVEQALAHALHRRAEHNLEFVAR